MNKQKAESIILARKTIRAMVATMPDDALKTERGRIYGRRKTGYQDRDTVAAIEVELNRRQRK